MKVYISFMLFLFGAAFSTAQNFVVSGTVYDLHDKTPLEHASIKLGSQETISNKKGEFLFKNINAGTYTISVSHKDCDSFTKSIEVAQNLELNIQLEHHAHDIEQVTLHSVHNNQGNMVVKTVAKDEISKNTTENIGNLLSKISGVGTLKTGNNIAKPIIHGLYGSRVSILNNGVKMAEQEWGVEHAPNIDINTFEHIDVIKGASALKYGSDAIGGVIMLQPENYKKKDTLNGTLSLSGISNGRGIGADFRILKTYESAWFVTVQGGYRKSGDLKTPEYYLWNTGAEFNSFSLSAGKREFLQGLTLDYSLISQELGIYRGSHIGNLEDFYAILSTQKPLYQRDFRYKIENPKQEIRHHLLKLSSYKRYENFGKLSLDYSFQFNHRKEFDLRRGDFYEIPALDLELSTHQLNLSHKIERGNWNLESGIDAGYQNNYSSTATQAKRLVPNYDKYTWGGYSIVNYKVFPKIWLEGGLRYDQSFYNVKMWYDKSFWENNYAAEFATYFVSENDSRVFTNPKLLFPSFTLDVGLEGKIADDISVKFNYAKVNRVPNIAELFSDGLHHSAAVVEQGDLRLMNEEGHQINLNFDTKFKVLQGLNFSVNPYALWSNNFINQVPIGVQNTIRGIFPVWKYEQIRAEMFGVDVDLDLKITDSFSFQSMFSYVYGQDKSNEQPLILMLPPKFSNTIQYRSASWKNFYFSIAQQTYLEQKRFPIYNPVVSIYENGAEVEKTLDLSTPPKDYTLWNFQVGMDIFKNLSVRVSGSNILNKKYRDYLNRMRFFSDEMGSNFIINLRYIF